MGDYRAIVLLCLNRTDGVIESGDATVGFQCVPITYVYDVYTAQNVVPADDVKIARTRRFSRNPQAEDIERVLSAASAHSIESITFICADGVLYPCFGMELRITGGGSENWQIMATLRLVFGFIIDMSAGHVSLESGRQGCTFTKCEVTEVLG